ncbi:MAG: hypothetical protein ACKOQM_05965 [Novosphingobium sp.]
MTKESWQVSDEILYLLFEQGRNKEFPWLKHRNIKLETGTEQAGFEGLLIQRLVSRKFVDVRLEEDRNPWSGLLPNIMRGIENRSQEYQISLRGLDYVIESLKDPNSHISKIKSGEIAISVYRYPRSSKPQSPAADRMVRFDDNEPEAISIASGLAQLSEDVRGANDPSISDDERSRVLGALERAREIWSSGQFKLIQLKIGVLIAVEDAAKLLKMTVKYASTALLVDSIKTFAKNHFHVDLDAI